jgi:hypothetical protein
MVPVKGVRYYAGCLFGFEFGGTMANQAPRTEYERELARFRELQQSVLRHLMEVGPTNQDTLCDKIDHDRGDEIKHTLWLLARGTHIAIDAAMMVSITELGMQHLRPCD